MKHDLFDIGVTTNSSTATEYRFQLANSWNPDAALISFHLSPFATEALSLSSDTADWVIEAVKKLNALGQLNRGWDSYGGSPISAAARRVTFDALEWLKNQIL